MNGRGGGGSNHFHHGRLIYECGAPALVSGYDFKLLQRLDPEKDCREQGIFGLFLGRG